jgi:endonuclease III
MTWVSDLAERSSLIAELLFSEYPEPETLLHHESCYQLLIGVILSARTTDNQVNRITPELFSRWPGPKELMDAELPEVEEVIRSLGFFHTKAKHIVGAAEAIFTTFGGTVPDRMEDLLIIPGLGRKGGNVILGNCFGKPAIIVDTHFGRVCRRLGLSTKENPEQLERELRQIIPEKNQTRFSMAVNLHGRYVCKSGKPACGSCCLRELCPFPEAVE